MHYEFNLDQVELVEHVLATSLCDHPAAELHEDASAELREHPRWRSLAGAHPAAIAVTGLIRMVVGIPVDSSRRCSTADQPQR